MTNAPPNRRANLAGLVLLAVILTSPSAAPADVADSLVVRVVLPYGRHWPRGAWTPFLIRIDTGPQAVDGRLVLGAAGRTFTVPLQISARSSITVPFLSGLPRREGGERSLSLSIRARGAVLHEERLELPAPAEGGGQLIGALCRPEAFGLMSSLNARPAVSLVRIDDASAPLLSDWRAYAPLDALVVTGASYPMLSAPQKEAIETWIAAGGTLLLALDDGARAGAGDAEALVRSWLARRTQDGLKRIDRASDETVLHGYDYGFGSIVVVPMHGTGLQGQITALGELMSRKRAPWLTAASTRLPIGLADSFRDPAWGEAAHRAAWAVILYALGVTVCLAFVRRAGRRVIVTVALLLSAGFAALIGFLALPSDPVRSESVALCETVSGVPFARVSQYHSLSSPRAASAAAARFARDAWPRSIPDDGAVDVVLADDAVLSFPLRAHEQRIFETRSLVRLGGTVTIDALGDGSGYRVTNGTRWPIRRPCLFIDGLSYPLGDELGPGAVSGTGSISPVPMPRNRWLDETVRRRKLLMLGRIDCPLPVPMGIVAPSSGGLPLLIVDAERSGAGHYQRRYR